MSQTETTTTTAATDGDAVPNGIYVTTPPELYRAVQNDPARGTTPVATFVRLMLAKHYDITIDVTSTAKRTYASDADKEMVTISRRYLDAAIKNALMAAYKAKLTKKDKATIAKADDAVQSAQDDRDALDRLFDAYTVALAGDDETATADARTALVTFCDAHKPAAKGKAADDADKGDTTADTTK